MNRRVKNTTAITAHAITIKLTSSLPTICHRPAGHCVTQALADGTFVARCWTTYRSHHF